MTYEEALQDIPFRYRDEARAYVELGRRAHSPVLVALLIGDWKRAVLDDEEEAVHPLLRFLTHRDVPPFCWGNPVRVARWEISGGSRGQVQRCA